MPAALDDIVSEYVHYNVSMYRRTFFFFIKKLVDCKIVSSG